MNLYKRVNLPSNEPVQFVGVYTLKWSQSPMNPTVGFVEVDENEQAARIAQLEAECFKLEEALRAALDVDNCPQCIYRGKRIVQLEARCEALGAALEPLVEFADYPQTFGANIHFNHNLDHDGFERLQVVIKTARAALRGQGAVEEE